jgi:hypothetical protein
VKTTTFSFAADRGWSAPLSSALDSERTLVLAFGATTFLDDWTALDELRGAYPRASVVGCSTSGEIVGTTVNDDTLAVAVTRFDHTDLRVAEARIDRSEDSVAAGRQLAAELTGPGLAAVLLFSDGLGVNGTELVRGLNAGLPEGVPVSGGLAGDGDRFQRTWTCANGAPRSGSVVAVGLYGSRIKVCHGSQGGWNIFGPERLVTQSSRNQLFQLDGRPALDLYKEYLGEHAAALPASALRFPLALRDGSSAQKMLVRTVLSIDEEKKSMTFAGNVPEGSLAQLMQTNLESLIDGAARAAQSISGGGGTAAEDERLSIAISCVGRRLLLGERAEEEVEAVLTELPGARQIGFYSYGEIAPYEGGFCDLHNQTMTVTTLSEV